MTDLAVDLVRWCFAKLQPWPLFHARSSRRSALRNWAAAMLSKRVVPLQVALGLLGVALAGEMTDGTNRAVRGAAERAGRAPGAADWQAYYLDGCLPFRELCSMLWPGVWDALRPRHDDESWTDAVTTALRHLRRAKRGDAPAARFVEWSLYLQDQLLSECLDHATGAGIGVDGNPATTADIVAAPAWRFLLQVFVPCLQKHGRRPDQLFADFADRGDAAALQQLLALDQSVQDHPAIHQRITDGLAAGDAAIRKAVGRVRLRPPTERQEHATLLIALLLKQFSRLWSNLTASVRAAVDRQAVGECVWNLLRQKTLNATDIRELLRAYDGDHPPSRLATFAKAPIEDASWDRKVDRFRTAKRPLDIANLTARKTVRVEL